MLSCNFTVYFQNAFPKSTSGGLLLEQGISEKKRTLIKKNKFLHLSFEILNENERCLEAVVQTCSCKMVFLEISKNLWEYTCARVSFLIKLQACKFIKKETLAQLFSREFCEISKNTFSYRAPPVAASSC